MVYTSLKSPDKDYQYDLHIAHLYGDLMNTYGDNGNILMLKYVAEKLGARVQVDIVSLTDRFDKDLYDIAFFGGGQDYELLQPRGYPFYERRLHIVWCYGKALPKKQCGLFRYQKQMYRLPRGSMQR
jgi:hypothetical protein